MRSFFLLIACLYTVACKPQATAASLQDQRFIFFLHNKFVEEAGPAGVHPEYGRVEYREIIHFFEQENFKVLSEIRPKNTDEKIYAAKVARQVDSLLKKGIQPSHITVIGTSKGGYMAMTVSGLLKNPELNFVFIGSCSGLKPELALCGNILSIYEKSDSSARSCLQQKQASSLQIAHFKELELNTGLKHGFLFKALKEWMAPASLWARQQY